MTIPVRSCALCGWVVEDGEASTSWLNQFRGLCSSPKGIILTGVGRYSDRRRGAFFAPPDPNARWDDPGYEHPDEDEFAVMRPQDINGKRGFIFHDPCWSLLEQAYHPAPVPRERLFEVCDSLPLVVGGFRINWGREYGGAIVMRVDDCFPWENQIGNRFGGGYTADPLAAAEVGNLLADTPRASSEPEHPLLPLRPLRRTGQDPFNSLPLELCSVVAEYLPTSDVLNARHASRSFWHVFHDQQFWASRFRGGLDRSWLFEVRDDKTASRNWCSLYRRTIDSHIEVGLRERKRIWAFIQHIAPILELKWGEVPSESLPEERRDWALAAGSMPDQQPESFCHLEKACRRVRSKQVAIPDGISQVATSTIRVGDSEYIAGITFSTPSGEALRLGYNTGRWHSVDISGLAGFNLAVGSGGIHALQCIDGRTKKPSAWLGCPDDVPRTERLALGHRITALDVGFDAFRIVSLSIARETNTTTEDRESTLRSSAIWYPDVPSPGLDLNEAFFVPLKSYTWGYKPVFWTCFGGPGGAYLPNLTKVMVSMYGILLRIDFSFDKEVPVECRMFGRNKLPEDKPPVIFQIDGPGGEVIDKVEVCQQFPGESQSNAGWLGEEGRLVWLKMGTNRGRECKFGTRSKLRSRPIVTRKISAAPGTAIIGFFGARVCDTLGLSRPQREEKANLSLPFTHSTAISALA
ncbi:hypothetical protein F5144DRAFT_209027 [Chaetomium tenue]|uniref:Uncharacterized protein n=1 Tax=Chaetomium tenue TaxID=1854479 RepID=A0ACB7PED1_9PEZI|nr:hypothetical protein F5144DRAFT_209027 [Chaetomium globosum]